MLRAHVLRPLVRHKKKAAAVFLSTLSAAVAITLVMSPRYKSEAQLFVRLGRENVAIDPTATLGNDNRVVATPQVRESEINSAVAVATSRAVAACVVDEIGPEQVLGLGGESAASASTLRQMKSAATGFVKGAVLRPLGAHESSVRDQAIAAMQKYLSVTAVAESRVIRVSYEAPDPELAQEIVQRVVNRFLDENMRLNRTPRAEEFLLAQSERLRAELEDSERAVCDLKNRAGLASVAYQVQLLADQISAAEIAHAEARREIASIEQETIALRGSLEEIPREKTLAMVSGMPNVGADGMREQLYSLERQEKLLLATYTKDYPEVRQLRAQIEDARRVLDADSPTRQEVTTGVNPVHSALESQLLSKEAALRALQGKEERIAHELKSLGERRSALNSAEVELTRLERDRTLRETDYRTFASKLVEAKIDRALEEQRISNIGIAQEATLESSPVSPNPLRNLLAGILSGIAGVVGVVYFAESTRSAVRLPIDVEQRTGIPLLVVVPELSRSQLRTTLQPTESLQTA